LKISTFKKQLRSATYLLKATIAANEHCTLDELYKNLNPVGDKQDTLFFEALFKINPTISIQAATRD
jgi:hypothetical protein